MMLTLTVLKGAWMTGHQVSVVQLFLRVCNHTRSAIIIVVIKKISEAPITNKNAGVIQNVLTLKQSK